MNQNKHMAENHQITRMGRLKCGRAVQDEIAPSDLERIRTFIAGHRWVFAKTMPQWPHEYTLRKNAPDEEEFLRLVTFIREHGYDERFGKSATYIYLNVDGWKYWSMGAPVPDTILINRARLT
jgi:hypothetical protein